jgi:carboxymethylenebutenolidase
MAPLPLPATSDWFDLPVADGSVMRAFAAAPEGPGPVPGLIVLQEIFGVDPHIQDLCRRFAAEGFLAVAPELFHRTAPGFTGSYDDYTPGRAHAARISPASLGMDIQALLAWFTAEPRSAGRKVGSIGYCLGGRMSFLAATSAPLDCAISFYGRDIPSHFDRLDRLDCPYLTVWGGADSIIPAEQPGQVAAVLGEAGKRHISMALAGAGHGFFCDRRASYNPGAALIAWPATLAFLHEHLD